MKIQIDIDTNDQYTGYTSKRQNTRIVKEIKAFLDDWVTSSVVKLKDGTKIEMAVLNVGFRRGKLK